MHERIEARKDLAAFLKARRSRLTPADVGLPQGNRRRTPGLRREELCQLAGIGLTWYTWLEQGRDISVSMRALEGLAKALRLDAHEYSHLIALTKTAAAEPATPQDRVSPNVQRVLDSITAPAYIINGRWDILAWNPEAVTIFGDFAAHPVEHRNLVWLVFAEPGYRELFVNWQEDAPRVLAKFRASYTREGGKSNAANHQLVTELSALSTEFCQWWDLQEVIGKSEGEKHFRLTGLGDVVLQHTSFMVGSDPNLRLVVYTWLGEASSDGVK